MAENKLEGLACKLWSKDRVNGSASTRVLECVSHGQINCKSNFRASAFHLSNITIQTKFLKSLKEWFVIRYRGSILHCLHKCIYIPYNVLVHLVISRGSEVGRKHAQLLAYCKVHSLAFLMAPAWSAFQASAISWSNGSSKFGKDIKAWIERRTDLICKAGDHLFFKISRQILPSLSMFGW